MELSSDNVHSYSCLAVRWLPTQIVQSKLSFQGDFTERQGLIANGEGMSQKLVIKRKELWKHNTIQTSRANVPPPGNKAVNSKIAKDRSVSANSANAKNKVAADKAAASKTDDKPGCLGLTSGGRRLLPLLCLAHLQDDQHCSAYTFYELEGTADTLHENELLASAPLRVLMTRLSNKVLG